VTLIDIERPRPVLDRERERRLTDRQRDLLDQLGAMFDEGFAELTMAELAARLNCSLRTLYALASSRDELVLIVVDRNLWRVGRSARSAIEPDMPPLDAIRSYLSAAHVAVMNTTEPFARDLAAVPAALRLQEAHQDYLRAVTKGLLDEALSRGDIAAIDTAAVARVLSRLGADFAKPDVLGTVQSLSPKDAADLIVDLVLRGLQRDVAATRGQGANP
jgi:AcrR family transcriptional regulator